MGLFEDITNWFRSLYDKYIAPAIKPLSDAANNAWSFLRSEVWPRLTDIGSRLANIPREAYSILAPKFEEAKSFLLSRVEPIKSFLETNVWPRIVQGFQAVESFRQQLVSKVFSIPIEIANRIHPLIAPIENWLKTQLPQVNQFLHSQVLPRLQQLNTTIPLLQGNIPTLTFQMLMPKVEEKGLDLKKVFNDALSPISDLLTFFKKFDISDRMNEVTQRAQSIMSQFASLAARAAFTRSMVTPEDAHSKEAEFMPQALRMAFEKDLIATIVEGLTLGQVDINLANLMNGPDVEVVRSTYIDVQKMKIEMGFLKPLEYYYNRLYTPEIPPTQDLITMVVREAFVPERVTPAPKLFADYMAWRGYSKEWADRYWTAHWVLIPLERVTEMYWRGIVSKKFYEDYLVLHDFRPDEIPYIMQWVWRPPNRIEARMMYDLGVLKDEDLDYIAKASGIEERFREGWKQMIRGYRVRPLLTKIETIATDAYENGYIGTAEYQKLLKEAGFSDVVIDWVMKIGQLERRFTLMKMSIDTIVLKFRKGVIDKNTAMRQLTSLGLDTDTALHHLAKAEVQAMRASDKAKEKAPKLTVAQLIAAWKAGVIETEDVVDALLAKGYTEQEARILIETELAKAAAAPA